MIKSITKYRCGHTKTKEYRHYIDKTDVYDLQTLCWDCKQKLIGKVVTVYRYGTPIEKSWNYADNREEEGMSCYFPEDRPRPEFTDRPLYVGTGIIIGYGSDDEPLVTNFKLS